MWTNRFFQGFGGRLTNLGRRLRSEKAFSLLPSLGVMLAASAMGLGTLQVAVQGQTEQRSDDGQKRAFIAAEAGVADYTQHLAEDTNYWAACDAVTSPSAVNEQNVSYATRKWLPTDSTTNFQYSIDLIPAPGFSTCKDTTDHTATMIDPNTSTFRIRVIGRAGDPAKAKSTWTKRTIVIDFRRRGFLDFAYLTNFETKDPPLELDSGDRAYAEANCRDYYRDGRNSTSCSEIYFPSGDDINGPFHTNDGIYTSTGANFGRVGLNDRIEISDGNCPYRSGAHSGCSNTATGKPVINGTLKTGVYAPVLPLPEANDDLEVYADPTNNGLTLSGYTTIVLGPTAGKMTITNSGYMGGVATQIDYPESRVVYVKAKAGCTVLNPQSPYPGSTNCGTVDLRGTYSDSLSIAAETDIVINGDVTRNTGSSYSNAVLGLIANQYVRIRHPVTNGSNQTCSEQQSSSAAVHNIQAAMMALQHSIVVDQWYCGTSRGTLNITGAMVQNFRGPVGTGNGNTGYGKNYVYDSRLKYRTPPYFLVPELAGWRTARFREQTPSPCVDAPGTVGQPLC